MSLLDAISRDIHEKRQQAQAASAALATAALAASQAPPDAGETHDSGAETHGPLV
jgi:hypothetical protein